MVLDLSLIRHDGRHTTATATAPITTATTTTTVVVAPVRGVVKTR